VIDEDLRRRIADAAGAEPLQAQALHGGCVASVLGVDLSDGRRIVAKVGAAGAQLDLEAWMLAQLGAAGWPVPGVLHAADDLLLIDFVAADGVCGSAGEEAAADLLAALHALPQPRFGFDRDTLIGGLPQPNPAAERWVPFFAEQRLLHRAHAAQRAGQLPSRVCARVEKLAGMLDRWLEEPAQPSLIHGDLWGGNILFDSGRVAAVIDPACYCADPEIELAFTTLFGTFGDAFFDRYQAHRPLDAGFFEARRELYNLYPLLVHVQLFGGSYVGAVERTLSRFGA
jgi:fructosamine-3-kinase